jgi:hypothetical protein
MIGVWFTHGPDGPCLVESVASFRAAGGEHVAVFDEERSPLTEDTLRAISPDLRETTSYPRGKNLRGWENIFGQLDCFDRAASFFGGDGVVKIDSDTLVFDFDWVDARAPMSGFMAGGEAFLFGLAYHIRTSTVATIRDSFTNRYRSDKDPVAEDRTISCEALWRFGQAVRVTGWDERRAGGWSYGKTPVERYANCAVVTFGNRSQIPNCKCDSDRRERMALEMANYRKLRAVAPVDVGGIVK